jgi:glucose 1-dehydrogenase
MNKPSSESFVMITGAAGGIGRATVHLFAEKGWHVIGVDRSPFGDDFPANGVFIQTEISNPDLMEEISHRVKSFTPSLNALVNNAAVQVAKPLIETTVEEWDMIIANNLRPAFLLSKLAYPLFLIAGGGAIVNVSSRRILLPMQPAKAAYCR